MNTRMRIVLSVFFLLIFHLAWGQQKPGTAVTPVSSAQTKDSVREVHLIRSDVLKFEKKDSTELQILVGNAMLRQENTFFNGDSIIMNKQQNVIEVFGNIHINDADSVNVYAQYLIYYGNTRIAHLRKNVKLSDGKATLTTEALEYDLNTKTGIYLDGGKIVTSTSTLTSKEGYYYADTKDAYFRKNVHLIDPEYTMATDTLLYNAETQIATFVSPTTINDGKSIIRTSDGYYDMNKGFANFGKRPVIEDSTQYITADHIQFDKTTGEGHAQGNFVYIDTTQGVTLLSEKSDFNRDTKTVLATGKPVMIIKQDNDSIFITGDSLYSGIKMDTLYVKDSSVSDGSLNSQPDQSALFPQQDSTVLPEPGRNTSMKLLERPLRADVSNKPPLLNRNKPLQAKDTASQPHADTLIAKQQIVANDPVNIPVVTSTDSILLPPLVKDSLPGDGSDSLAIRAKTLPGAEADTVKGVQVQDIDRIDSVRFFQAFRHVRIFSDSMQAVCDSMFFSGRDSIFRLYIDPIVWAKESQITGDTIYLYTRNKKPDHIEVLENAFSISRSNDSFYNQLKGNVINGFFKDGDIDHIVAKGSAESLYYLQDNDSAYTGANYAQADLINLYFIQKELDKITWLYQVKGGFYPVTQVPEERRRFRNFKWEEARRPKTRMELFE
ncbi:OstA-like protein [Agriterribacter sp.]|uniref:OstA-like protein n=1 Tax=Agriterribacter sp. TaxID=2821509 RepID=UPI002B79E09F|nr:OstA-like protein [Agriterribacter sp.]HRO46005.1 OstA-like protein [Agriterribacter sp.]HRQ17041.1 OstA-like protein [Agriterribacter sp.]